MAKNDKFDERKVIETLVKFNQWRKKTKTSLHLIKHWSNAQWKYMKLMIKPTNEMKTKNWKTKVINSNNNNKSITSDNWQIICVCVCVCVACVPEKKMENKQKNHIWSVRISFVCVCADTFHIIDENQSMICNRIKKYLKNWKSYLFFPSQSM